MVTMVIFAFIAFDILFVFAACVKSGRDSRREEEELHERSD